MNRFDPLEPAEAGKADVRAPRRALVVLGMHRSGTSAVAGCLQRLGVDLGPRLMPATAANRKGYYEHIDVVNLHDRLLMSLGVGWDTITPWPERWWEDERTARFRVELLGLLRRDFGPAVLWGIKDPRMCRLLRWWRSLWAELATEPVFLIVVRDPRQVAASLQRRDGISQTKSYVLWWHYMLAAERETRGQSRFFLDFTDFGETWIQSFTPLSRVLGNTWLSTLSRSRDENQSFLSGFSPESLSPPVVASSSLGGLDEVWTWFKGRCGCSHEGAGGHIDELSSSGWLEAAVRQQTDGERASDLAIEMHNARKLAGWYEAEWNKFSLRAAKYKARLDHETESAHSNPKK